jgi:hypothetical protein
MEPYNFAHINPVDRVERSADFSHSLNQSFESDSKWEEEEQREEEKPVVNIPPLHKGFVYPNPVNLSPIIAQVVGKGISVNEYV